MSSRCTYITAQNVGWYLPTQHSSTQYQTKYTKMQGPCRCLQQHNARKVRILEDIKHVHKKGVSIDKEYNKWPEWVQYLILKYI
jgi:hypothetical protein